MVFNHFVVLCKSQRWFYPPAQTKSFALINQSFSFFIWLIKIEEQKLKTCKIISIYVYMQLLSFIYVLCYKNMINLMLTNDFQLQYNIKIHQSHPDFYFKHFDVSINFCFENFKISCEYKLS